jgi:nicotinamide mononucleotide transporter
MEFIQKYGLEAAGTLASLIYLFYSIREKSWLWPWGLVASALMSVGFYQVALYADMGLQFYYIVVSIYGWWYWINGNAGKNNDEVSIKLLSKQLFLKLTIVGIVIYLAILLVLLKVPAMVNISSSELPYLDSFTTAASIIATWMLARKYIHHWLFWVVIDLVSMGMYIYKGLYFYSFLYLVFTAGAIVGYLEWTKTVRGYAKAV